MEDVDKTIRSLIEEGEHFTYDNFSLKGKHGYPSSASVAWVTWTTRVAGAIGRIFSENSEAQDLLNRAKNVGVLYNGSDKFEQAKASYLGALKTAQSVLSQDTFGESLIRARATGIKDLSNKVFVVHGHDDAAKSDLEILLAEMGLDPVVLHRQADGGMTIIEKFEQHADVGFAFILLTPDEVAYLAAEAELPDDNRKKEFRARPNVIFEFGYFVGRLGRGRTCCLHTGNVTLPSDLSGLIYKRFERNVEEVAYSIQKELKAAGYILA